MKIPKSVVALALKHRVNVGRDEHGAYFVRDPRTLKVVESTSSAAPTAAQAIAMIRRYVRRRVNPAKTRRGSARMSYAARYANGKRIEFTAASDAAAVRYARGIGAHRARSKPKSVLRLAAAAPPKPARGARAVRRNPSQRDELEQAARAFEDFTGHEATRVERHRGVTARAGWLLGRCTAISYIATRDGETVEYVHRFKRRSRPQLVSSADGSQLYLLGGAYSVTDRGIVDA